MRVRCGLGGQAQPCISRDMKEPASLVIIFDTDCVMCSAWVRFVLRYESAPLARFVSAWSAQGLELASKHGLSLEDLDRTYLVVSNGKGLTKSEATFAILSTLRAPWRWISLLKLVPRPLRDGFYDVMANNRYRWFGRTDQCFMPTEEHAARFVPGPSRSSVVPDHR